MNASYVEWLRSHVGHRKVFLPFATVILRDDQNRVLIQQRADFDFWGLPGGVLELNEDIETGARRELLEETGLTVDRMRLVGIYTDPKYDVLYPNGDQVQQFTFCLEGKLSGGVMQADGIETTNQMFVSVGELQEYPLPVWYRDMLVDAGREVDPQFREPYSAEDIIDQIAQVRPSIGKELYSGVGATVVLTRGNGDILMLQHVGEAHWRLPSGFSNIGENAAQTAVREVWEELRLNIEPLRLIGVHATPALNSTYSNGDQVRNVGVVFQARQLGGEIALDDVEVNDMAWMNPQEALSNVHPSRREHYGKIMCHLESGCFIS